LRIDLGLFLSNQGHHMHGLEQTDPHHLHDPTRIIAVRLVNFLRRQHRSIRPTPPPHGFGEQRLFIERRWEAVYQADDRSRPEHSVSSASPIPNALHLTAPWRRLNAMRSLIRAVVIVAAVLGR
jgi:hypothetical protein